MKRSKLWLARILCGVFLFGSAFSLAGCKKEKNDFVASEFVVLENWFFTSGIANNIIQINLQDEEIICVFKAEKGELFAKDGSGCLIETKTNEEVCWDCYASEDRGSLVYSDYITIILLKKNEIVGYAVLEITLEGGLDYEAKILKQVLLKDMISEC